MSNLELKPVMDDPPPEQDSPTLHDLSMFHEELEAYIDRRVAALRLQYVGLPPGTIRATLTRGLCLCAAVQRLLKEPQ